jgi:membrane protein YqaA with SNARE-associated domain
MTDPTPTSLSDPNHGPADPPAPVSRWALHRRLYNWVLSFARHRHAVWALFALSFAEASFFVVPPDVLLIPMAMERRSRALRYAAVCTAASVLGGMLGYLIGWGLWQAVDGFLFEHVPGFEEKFDTASRLYDRYDFWIVFLAGFTPLPYKIFTIAGGVARISFPMLIIASIVGRGARFFLVAALMWRFGASAKVLIDRYFNLVCVLFAILMVGGFAALKLL